MPCECERIIAVDILSVEDRLPINTEVERLVVRETISTNTELGDELTSEEGDCWRIEDHTTTRSLKTDLVLVGIVGGAAWRCTNVDLSIVVVGQVRDESNISPWSTGEVDACWEPRESEDSWEVWDDGVADNANLRDVDGDNAWKEPDGGGGALVLDKVVERVAVA